MLEFEVKNGYELELNTPETQELLGSAEGKFVKQKFIANIPKLELVEDILFHFNPVTNNYEKETINLKNLFTK